MRYYLRTHDQLTADELSLLALKFWAQVDKTGDCWEWTGSLNGNGYGGFRLSHEITSAHRSVWILTYGPIPAKAVVAHKCDNRKCVRPDHLFIGTQSDNILDSVAKGRWPMLGERHRSARLNPEKVRWIRRVRQSHRFKYHELAWLLSVSTTAIRAVLKGITWRKVAA